MSIEHRICDSSACVYLTSYRFNKRITEHGMTIGVVIDDQKVSEYHERMATVASELGITCIGAVEEWIDDEWTGEESYSVCPTIQRLVEHPLWHAFTTSTKERK